MTEITIPAARRLGREFGRAFSAQSRQSNRIWLTLIFVAAITLFNEAKNASVNLPLSLGSVPAATYNVVTFLVLTILLTGFCQAFSLTHAAVRYAQDTIDQVKPPESRTEARRFFDISVISAFSRVAQLASVPWSNRLSAIFYCILKAVAMTILVGVPISALVRAFYLAGQSGWGLFFLLAPVLAIGLLGVAKIIWLEAKHTLKVRRLILDSEIDRQFGLTKINSSIPPKRSKSSKRSSRKQKKLPRSSAK